MASDDLVPPLGDPAPSSPSDPSGVRCAPSAEAADQALQAPIAPAHIPIWLAIHAVQCWWNKQPIRGGTIDIRALETMFNDVAKSARPKEDPAIYPCADCGVMRTKSEGGTTFTVCDQCWDKAYKKP